MIQLNSIFGKSVPCGVGPYALMSHLGDAMGGISAFEQSGVELILKTLRHHPDPVEICIFGSCRTLAVAYNRAPELLKKKVKRVHINAGCYPAGYLEWNVMLDPFAFQRLVESELHVALYPCATPHGPFDKGTNNTFWKMPDLDWIRRMHPKLRRYLGFALQRVSRMDFLRALEEDWPELGEPGAFDPNFHREHYVWETEVWLQIANLRLVERHDCSHKIIMASEVMQGDRVLSGNLKPVHLSYAGNGQVEIGPPETESKTWLYERDTPAEQEIAFCAALPALYQTFSTPE